MKTILLLHGAIGSKKQLDPLASYLKKSFDVHAINFDGHGGETMTEAFSIKRFSENVLAYLETNQMKEVAIFGYSMGGYVALYLAKLHPEKISKIFTLATKFSWTPEIAQQEIKMLDADKIVAKIPAFANELQLRHMPNDWKTVLQKTSEMMVALGNENPLKREDFKDIKIPVSLNVGDKDMMVSVEETRKVYENLPNAVFNILPDMQHPIEKVNIQKLAISIEAFFA